MRVAGSLENQNSRNLSIKNKLCLTKAVQSELHVAGPLSLNYTWRDHSVWITHGGITQSEYMLPQLVSVHVAGSLDRNYMWRDHWVWFTRGGITQSEFPKRTHLLLFRDPPRGGITQSELHGAGSLSLNSLKGPICYFFETPHQSELHVVGSLDLDSGLHMAGSPSLNYTWRDHWIWITHGRITQSELHVAGSLSLKYTGRDHSVWIP